MDGGEETTTRLIGGDDHVGSRNGRRRSVAVLGTKRSDLRLPGDFPIQAQRREPNRIVDHKGGKQVFSVAGDGRRGVRVLCVHVHESAAMDFALPTRIAGFLVDGNDGLRLCVLIGGGEKNLATPDRRAGVATSG